MPYRASRMYWLRLKRLLRRVGRSPATPHQIAVGASIGFFVGMTPTVGLQMVIAAMIATLLRVSRLAAVVPVWVTNPVTILPIYTFNYWLGRLLVGGADLHAFEERIRAILAFARGAGISGIPQTTARILGLGAGMLAPLWLGSILVGLALAVPAYSLVLGAVVRFRAGRERRRNDRDRRIAAHREQADAIDASPAEDAPAPSSDASSTAPPPPTEPSASVGGGAEAVER